MSDESLGKDYPERNQEKDEDKNDGSAQEASLQNHSCNNAFIHRQCTFLAVSFSTYEVRH